MTRLEYPKLEYPKSLSFIQPDWPIPSHVKAYQTTRYVAINDLQALSPQWLKQVHGNRVVERTACSKTKKSLTEEADACFTREPGILCAIQTADCIPLLLCDRKGTVVAALHAGWRGLLAGIIEVTVAALPVEEKALLAWLGPAIGPAHFEVGDAVYSLFKLADAASTACFMPHSPGKWLANLYQLAKQCLWRCGLKEIYGGEYCTYRQEDLFFSYRRDLGETGRMATLIWIEDRR